jgi:hypothetical protein
MFRPLSRENSPIMGPILIWAPFIIRFVSVAITWFQCNLFMKDLLMILRVRRLLEVKAELRERIMWIVSF